MVTDGSLSLFGVICVWGTCDFSRGSRNRERVSFLLRGLPSSFERINTE
jgi:hypothetical protein